MHVTLAQRRQLGRPRLLVRQPLHQHQHQHHHLETRGLSGFPNAMPLHVYLREAPRALVLAPAGPPGDPTTSRYAARSMNSDPYDDGFEQEHGSGYGQEHGKLSFALVLAPAPRRGLSAGNTAQARTDAVTVQADLVPMAEIDLRSLRRLTPSMPASGCLGLMNIGSDLFLAVATYGMEAGCLRPGEVVMKLNGAEFFCLNRSTWDDLVITNPNDPTTYSGQASAGYDEYQTQPNVYEHPCAGVRRLLANGTFYYAQNQAFDLSTRLDRRCPPKGQGQTHDISMYQEEFVWNTYMLESLLTYRSKLQPDERDHFDQASFLLCLVRGYVGTSSLPSPPTSASQVAPGPSSISLISRLSWKRAGTRINTRGIDDDGNVANFVEVRAFIMYMAPICFAATLS